MDTALSSLLQEIAKEEDFCVPDATKGERLKPLLKALYDGACEATKRSFGPLRTLVVEGLDEESIWEQVQTRKNLTRFAEKRVSALDRKIAQRAQAREEEEKNRNKKNKKRVTMHTDSDEEEDSEEHTDEDSEGSFGDDSDAHLDEDDDEDNEDDDDDDDEDDEDNDDDEEEEEEEDNDDGEEMSVAEGEQDDEEGEEEEDEEAAVRAATQRLEAFDEDVKMEAWLDAFEEDEQRHKERAARKERRAAASTVESREWENEDEGEDDLEFIGNHLYEESDDEEEEELDPRSIRFEDFFVDESRRGKKSSSSSAAAANKKRRTAEESEDSEEEEEDDEEEREEGESDEEDMDMDFDGVDDYEDSAAEDDDGEDGEEEEEDDEDEEDVRAGQKKKSQESFSTAFQKRKQELQEQISELEKSLVADKSWELKGEVKAGHRPENSLLSVPVDVERSVKVAPLITQDYTTSLEEKIIERIKAGRFDDPSPAHAAPDNVITDNVGPDEGDLSQEKSKVGLGELYAEEYAKKLENSGDTLDVQTQAVRDEAINLYNAVARQLDALTHFFFTPKPVAAEANAKVLATQRAMPALEMEDITPFGQNSTGSAVAPEQVLEKKRGKAVTLLTSAELTREDRKKLRRHKKAVRKVEKKAQEKDTSVKNLRKQAEKKLTEELKADKRVVLAQEGGKKAKHEDSNQYGKSSSFFSKLQQESQQQIASKAGKPNLKRKREEEGPAKSSSGFKL